jgi:hypothetical protein
MSGRIGGALWTFSLSREDGGTCSAWALFFAAVSAAQVVSEGDGGILKGFGAWLLASAAMTPVVIVGFGFLAGWVLVAWQAYRYLKFGNWPDVTVGHIFYVLGSDPSLTQWGGVNQLITMALKLSAPLTLLLLLPALFIFFILFALFVTDRTLKAFR